MPRYNLGQKIICKVNPRGGDHAISCADSSDDEYQFIIIGRMKPNHPRMDSGPYQYFLSVPSTLTVGWDGSRCDFNISNYDWIKPFQEISDRIIGCYERSIIRIVPKDKCKQC